jgi:hypothetical protein
VHRDPLSLDGDRKAVDEARSVLLLMNPRSVSLLRATGSRGASLATLASRTGRTPQETQLLTDQLLKAGVVSGGAGKFSPDMQQIVSLLPY